MNSRPDLTPDAMCDGGDLDCGSGLLLIIRNAMSPLAPGGVLEVRSRETSVKEDLPAWCRLVGHDMLANSPGESGSTSYFIRKKAADTAFRQDLERARNYVWRARVRGSGGYSCAIIRSLPGSQPALTPPIRRSAPSSIFWVLLARASRWGFNGAHPSEGLQSAIWKCRCRPARKISSYIWDCRIPDIPG